MLAAVFDTVCGMWPPTLPCQGQGKVFPVLMQAVPTTTIRLSVQNVAQMKKILPEHKKVYSGLIIDSSEFCSI